MRIGQRSNVKRRKVIIVSTMYEHVETVCLLSGGEIDSKKIKDEFSLENRDMSDFQNDRA